MPLTKATQNVVEGIVSTGSTGVSAGSFQVGQQYKITSLGTTTQSQWNTIAGTTGQTYVVGSLFTAATNGAGSGNGAAAVARTLANRFADVVNVKDFGAVGNGVADDTLAIQAAINFCASRNGGYVNIPSGVYKISNTISITTSNIKIIGNGGDFLHDAGIGTDGATKIIWAGSSGGTMVEIKTIPSVSNSKINGCNLIGIEFNGSNSAGIAISIISHNFGKFENLFVQDVTQVAYKISNWVAGTIAEAADSQANFFNQCSYRLIDDPAVRNATGFYLTSQNPTASGANTSGNLFQFCGGQTYSGIAWLLDDADNNTFIRCGALRIYDNNYAFDLRNQATNGNAFYEAGAAPAFNTIGAGGTNPNSIKCSGTASGYTGNPFANEFRNLDNTNGTQPPISDAGVKTYWSLNTGLQFTKDLLNVAIGNTVAAAINARINIDSTYASLLQGSSVNVLGLVSNGGIYNFEVPNSGLRIRKITGSGTKTELWNDFEIFSGDIYPTVDDSKSCGKSGNRWSAIWSANGTIQTSDEREKKDIKDSELGLDFITSLRPVSYKWIDGGKEVEKIVYRDKDGNEVDKDLEGAFPAEIITKSIPGQRTHFGLLSQEVKAALPDGVDFGGWVLTDKENPDSQQALRYDQFIAPLIKAVQEQQKQIEELSAEVAALKAK
jgi:hypothetical protein